ncbi:hypothetical protein TNIN_2771 [Trichonephila inaurata madagascariensis]|uniref:Transposase n=1 Tax=Trichonephila inaurata madagascariensis TaxID=2747483 RepID=A0A8X7CJ35_9ARAC|nr:hypothetical protein TNIN_2771 [Trichonephila inaurata madagascariensis]
MKDVVLLHDNARSHVPRVTHKELVKFKWELLDHSLYSPDMSSCDFHVYGSLKKHLKRKRQLGRGTQGRCEGLGLVTVTGILETRNSLAV